MAGRTAPGDGLPPASALCLMPLVQSKPHARSARVMNVLVTGGAGYIGSHMVRVLQRAGHQVVVLDDLSAGHADAVPADTRLVVADIRKRDVVLPLLREAKIDP